MIPGWSSLSTTERVVSELVAKGLTNREVGSRMEEIAHAHLASLEGNAPSLPCLI